MVRRMGLVIYAKPKYLVKCDLCKDKETFVMDDLDNRYLSNRFIRTDVKTMGNAAQKRGWTITYGTHCDALTITYAECPDHA